MGAGGGDTGWLGLEDKGLGEQQLLVRHYGHDHHPAYTGEKYGRIMLKGSPRTAERG